MKEQQNSRQNKLYNAQNGCIVSDFCAMVAWLRSGKIHLYVLFFRGLIGDDFSRKLDFIKYILPLKQTFKISILAFL